jgi:hypothetical protein
VLASRAGVIHLREVGARRSHAGFIERASYVRFVLRFGAPTAVVMAMATDAAAGTNGGRAWWRRHCARRVGQAGARARAGAPAAPGLGRPGARGAFCRATTSGNGERRVF